MRWKEEKAKKLTAVLRAAEDLAASCLRGALPPVDLRAVCLVRAIGMNVVVVVVVGGESV
ncbi:hypothetical protein B0H11DRAFT_2119073 [Mycena galericulata]|nr:hypothetical protein B0H11DRAFT_2119073 [Mycena galericulata]